MSDWLKSQGDSFNQEGSRFNAYRFSPPTTIAPTNASQQQFCPGCPAPPPGITNPNINQNSPNTSLNSSTVFEQNVSWSGATHPSSMMKPDISNLPLSNKIMNTSPYNPQLQRPVIGQMRQEYPQGSKFQPFAGQPLGPSSGDFTHSQGLPPNMRPQFLSPQQINVTQFASRPSTPQNIRGSVNVSPSFNAPSFNQSGPIQNRMVGNHNITSQQSSIPKSSVISTLPFDKQDGASFPQQAINFGWNIKHAQVNSPSPPNMAQGHNVFNTAQLPPQMVNNSLIPNHGSVGNPQPEKFLNAAGIANVPPSSTRPVLSVSQSVNSNLQLQDPNNSRLKRFPDSTENRAPSTVSQNLLQPLATANDPLKVPVPSSQAGTGKSNRPSSKERPGSVKQPQASHPMLENPLLKVAREQGTVEAFSSNEPNSAQMKSKSDVSITSGKVREKASEYNEEEDEDDGDYTDEASESYSSDSRSSSPDYDLEGQASFKDSSAANALASKSHQLHKQATRLAASQNASTSSSSTDVTGGRSAQELNRQKYLALVEKSKQTNLNSNFSKMNLDTSQKMCVDLLRERNLIPEIDYEGSAPLLQEEYRQYNCPPDIMSCTLNIVPNSSSLLSKARLPLGLLMHPLKDVENMPETGSIIRCRLCRMYINPFVTLVDSRRWRCNMCCRYNELPDDFLYNHKTQTYTDGRHRTELNSSCYEIVTPHDYSVRVPLSPAYVFLLDVSFNAIETGYLNIFCESMIENLDSICTDDKVRVAFITFNSHIHFYNLHHSLTQPQVFHMPDLEDVILPYPDGLLVNAKKSRDMIQNLLRILPTIHKDTKEIGSCLGTAMKTAFEILNNGGRVTVFQTKLPDVGEGALKPREDPNKRSAEVIENLSPATDFYKKLALESSTVQIGYDLFLLNTQYIDMSTVCTAAKFTGGSLEYFPNFHITSNVVELDRLRNTLYRYFTRRIGFEAVFRIRCTRGLSLQMFHGNGFVRSIDLLALPIVNPDYGFAVQMSIDDSLEDSHACVQAALLYTNTKSERRLRVQTLCLKVSSEITDIFYNANQQAIIAFVAKMAVDRALTSSVVDSREALESVAYDVLHAFGKTISSTIKIRQLPCPYLLRSIPLFILALIKSAAFRLGVSTRLDDRIYSLEQMKTLPWPQLLQYIYPHFYSIHDFDEKNAIMIEDKVICQPLTLPLSAGFLDKQGAYLLDTGSYMYLWLAPSIKRHFLRDAMGVSQFGSLNDGLFEFPVLDNPTSENVRNFIDYLNSTRPVPASLILIREDGRDRVMFYERLIEDRTSDITNMSYIEFLRSIYEKLPTD